MLFELKGSKTSKDNLVVNAVSTAKKKNNNANISIVCFAGCDWWYHNRGLFCPQIMTRLAKYYNVLFVNSLGMRVPSLKKDKHAFRKIFRKLKSITKYYRQINPNFNIISPLSIPSSNLILTSLNHKFLLWQIKWMMKKLGIRNPIYYIGCPPAIDIVKELHPSYIIYERTDLFSEMPGINKEYITSLDQELARNSNLVLYVNQAMYEEGIKYNSGSMCIGHGVDYDIFANAYHNPFIPADIKNIKKPIVGFFGDISTKTSDFDLIEFTIKNASDL